MKNDHTKDTDINQTGTDEWGPIQNISYNEKTGLPAEPTSSQIQANIKQ
ncbi:hypothetical protein [Bacillus marasmi]|nr:hypothetical protein [Bacillus marasmi]